MFDNFRDEIASGVERGIKNAKSSMEREEETADMIGGLLALPFLLKEAGRMEWIQSVIEESALSIPFVAEKISVDAWLRKIEAAPYSRKNAEALKQELIREIHSELEDGGVLSPTLLEVLPERIQLNQKKAQLQAAAEEARALKGRFMKPQFATAVDVARALQKAGLVNWIGSRSDLESDRQRFYPDLCLATLEGECDVCKENHNFAEFTIWNEDWPEEYLAMDSLDYYLQGFSSNVGGGWTIQHSTLPEGSCHQIPYRMGMNIKEALGGSGFFYDSEFASVRELVKKLGELGIELVEQPYANESDLYSTKFQKDLVGQFAIQAKSSRGRFENSLSVLVSLDSNFLWENGIQEREILDTADAQISGWGWDLCFFVEASNLIAKTFDLASIAEFLGGEVMKNELPMPTAVKPTYQNSEEIMSQIIASRLGELYDIACWNEFPDFGSRTDWEDGSFRALQLSMPSPTEPERVVTLFIQVADSDGVWMRRRIESQFASEWGAGLIGDGWFVLADMDSNRFTSNEIESVLDPISETLGGLHYKG